MTLGIVVAIGMAGLADRREEATQSRDVLSANSTLLQRLTDAETGQRGYLITGDTAYLAPYRGARADAIESLERLRALRADRPGWTTRVDSIGTLMVRRLDVLDTRAALRSTAGFDSARSALMSGSGLELMTAVRALTSEIEREERILLERLWAAEARGQRTLAVVLVLGTLFAAAVALYLNDRMGRYADQEREYALELSDRNQKLQEQAVEMEVQQQTLQEQTIELEAQALTLQDQAGELEAANEQLQATSEELEERTRLAEELRERADIANAAKSEFLSAMSHELRTPLNAITGYVELLEMGLRGAVSEPQLADLHRIKRNSKHLLSLINEVLSFARIEAGQVHIALRPVSVAEVLANVEPTVAPQIGSRELSYVVETPASGMADQPEVLADPDKLHQVVVNLLANAIKFTERGGRIEVACGSTESQGWITVSDSGRGIASEHVELIFEPFVQLDRDFSRASQHGLGLGLAISRDLVRRMGGELTVTSTEGVGSTFTIWLPRVPSSAPAVEAPPATGIGTGIRPPTIA